MDSSLSVSTYQVGQAAVLRLDGDLSGDTLAGLKATLERLEPVLDGLLHDGGTVLVLDLSAVTTCDFSGLAILSAISDAATQAGVEPRLAAAPDHIRTALRESQLGGRIAYFSTVAGAARDEPQDLRRD